MIKLEKIIRYCLAFICAIGCLYQILMISIIYFSYETVTDVRYGIDAFISLPAITICTLKSSLMRKDYLQQNGIQLQDYTSRLDHLNNLTIKEQFKALYTAEEILNLCYTLGTEGLNHRGLISNCINISKIRTSIDYDEYCITLFSQSNGEPDQNYLIDFDSNLSRDYRSLVYITLKFSFNYLFLHSRNEIIRYSKDKYELQFNQRDQEIISIRYRITSVLLMSKPYSTSCLNYNLKGYYSRSECIFQCKTSYFKKQMNVWPGNYKTDDNEINLFMYDDSESRLKFYLRDKCNKICGSEIDCYNEFYSYDVIREPINTINYRWIHIRKPFYPKEVVQHWPKIRFEEYLCFVASIMSLWFGLSIMMLTNLCIYFVKYFVKVIHQYNSKFFFKKANIKIIFPHQREIIDS